MTTDEQIALAAAAIHDAAGDLARNHVSMLGVTHGVVFGDGIVRLTLQDAARIALKAVREVDDDVHG